MGQLITPAISNLPPEILSFIFLINAPGSLDSSYRSNRVKILQDTARYTSQVCRRWRFLLLDNPIIWSRSIDFTYGSHVWTEELLRRAAGCPLILLSRYGSSSSDLLARELEHVSRFGLYYSTFNKATWPLLLDKLHQPAPYLEELSLRASDIGQYTLPATIFNGNAPRLRLLQLESCSFDEALPYLPQLTQLWEQPNETGEAFSPRKWLDILPSMPLLTVLQLHGVDIGTHPHATVHLPNLTLFAMTAPLRECGAFLPCLILPPTCDMSVTARDAHPGAYLDVTAGIIIKNLPFYLSESIGSDHALYLHLGSNFFDISNLLISRTGVRTYPNTRPRPRRIHFHLAWTPHELRSILPHVSAAFAVPLSHVTLIEFSLIGLTSEVAHPAIVDFLLQANNVTSLVRVNCKSAKILLQLGRLSGFQTGKDVIFPSLCSIHVSERVMWPYDDWEVLQPFVDFMQHRINIGAPIEEIYYAALGSGDDDEEYLKETWGKIFKEYSFNLVYYHGQLVLHGDYGIEKPG